MQKVENGVFFVLERVLLRFMRNNSVKPKKYKQVNRTIFKHFLNVIPHLGKKNTYLENV